MVVELAIGAVGALASLTAALVKTLKSKKQSEAEPVTLTLERGQERIQRRGLMRPDDVSTMLEMMGKESAPGQPVSTK